MSIISDSPPQCQQARLREVALATHDAGLCALPPREDGSKAPMGNWQQYQHDRPSYQQLQTYKEEISDLSRIKKPQIRLSQTRNNSPEK